MTNPQQQQSSSVPVAVDRNGELHDTNDIERAPYSLVPPLRCADCGAALEAVRAYPRRDGPRIIHVAAHYRLAPGAAHLPTCPWRTDEPLRTPDTRRAAQPQASSLVYSLVVPDRGQRRANAWRHRSHVPNRRPAINSATSVANILRRHGEDAVNIRIDYRGRSITWRDFLLSPADMSGAALLAKDERVRHPLAVVGCITEPATARFGRSHYAELKEPLDSSRTHGRVRIILRASDLEMLVSCPDGGRVVALGWWSFRLTNLVEATLWVHRRWQVSRM